MDTSPISRSAVDTHWCIAIISKIKPAQISTNYFCFSCFYTSDVGTGWVCCGFFLLQQKKWSSRNQCNIHTSVRKSNGKYNWVFDMVSELHQLWDAERVPKFSVPFRFLRWRICLPQVPHHPPVLQRFPLLLVCQLCDSLGSDDSGGCLCFLLLGVQQVSWYACLPSVCLIWQSSQVCDRMRECLSPGLEI